MVHKLPDKFDLPKPGLSETVDEIPSPTDYYDGADNLNVLKINCTIYANPKVCLTHSNCGWCGASNKCILGNNLGPQESCPRSSYIFSAPYPNWDPQARVVKGEFGGVDLSILNRNQPKELKNIS
jgi:hypothetical protein